MDKNRTCGECTVCCYTHAIQGNNKEIVKGPMQDCGHCTVGSGCNIYNDPAKPQSCSTFKCFWLEGGGRSEHRPDKIGLVVVHNGDVLRLITTKPGALESTFAKACITVALSKGHVVLHTSPEGRHNIVVAQGRELSDEDVEQFAARNIGVEYFAPQGVPH